MPVTVRQAVSTISVFLLPFSIVSTVLLMAPSKVSDRFDERKDAALNSVREFVVAISEPHYHMPHGASDHVYVGPDHSFTMLDATSSGTDSTLSGPTVFFDPTLLG